MRLSYFWDSYEPLFQYFRKAIDGFDEKKFKDELIEFTKNQNAPLSHVLNECKRLSSIGKPMPWEQD